MYLKSLNLLGFKSFGERTLFEFGRGVTAVVGPNGCGKSNVLDSLKWVLGEQSAKSLRGGEMLDVIFNGSGNRKPLGFSEVSLTFGDVGQTLGVDYDEVMVTRRLYRTGDSEYEMNKNSCRLRDIRELFMDTGVGVVAYSIIEQGRIDALLTANSQERRHIFEEAAGISRYKWKAAEAGRRLERVDQNLARLTDLVQELSKQLGTVQRQAARAKRYTELTARQRDLRVAQTLHRYHKLHAESADVSGRLALLTEEKARTLAADSQRQTDVAREEEALLALTGRLQEAQGRVGQAATRIEATGRRIEDNRRLGKDSSDREAKLLARADEARGEAGRLVRERTEAERRLAEARAAEASASAAVAESEAEGAAARDAEEAARAAVGSATAALFEGEREASDARNARDRAASDLDATGRALRKALERRGDVAGRRDAAAAAAEKARGEVAEIEGCLSSWYEAFHRAEAEAKTATRTAGEAGEAVEKAREREREVRSRRDVLAGFRDRMEGIPAGVAGLLRAAAEGDAPAGPMGPMGIEGLLADLLDVDPANAAAIEAALGEAARGLVCATRQDAFAALEALRARAEGRGVLLPLAGGALPPVGDDPPLPPGPGVVGWARQLAPCAPEWAPLRDRLLAGILVVESVAVARRIEGDGGGVGAARIVTRAGEVLAPESLAGGPAGQGPLAERAELTRLDAEIGTLASETSRLAAARDAAAERQRATEASEEELRHRIYDGKVQREQARKDLAARDKERDDLAEELRILALEVGDLERRAGAAREAVAAAEVRIAAAEGALAEGRAALAAHEARSREAAAAVEAAARASTERKVAAAVATEKRERVEQEVPALEARRGEKEAEAGRHAADAAAARAAAEKAAEEIRADESALADLLDRRATLEREVTDLGGRKADAEQKREQRREEARAAAAERDRIEGALRQLEIQEVEQRKDREGLAARLREDYQLDLEELHGTYDPGKAPDPETLDLELKEVSDKLARLGNVNLEALTELTELEQRHAFLTTQQEDLTSARAQLQEIIKRINRRSREMFELTFAQVKQNFQVIFRQLFGGGKADIVLEDETDVLQSGIEIIAKPPGKEPASISLLSGGEKVMTCIAVLFAVFRSKPSPFCILDEVDAALDETNIDRFIAMLKEFTRESQFVIITHNKRTMAAAEAIYGVTMPEPGVSRPISMRLEEAVQHAQEPAPGGGSAPAAEEPTPAGAMA